MRKKSNKAPAARKAADTGRAHGPGFPLPTAQEAGFDFPPCPRLCDSIGSLRELVRHGRKTLIEWAEEDKPAERRFCLAVARGWITEWWNLTRRVECPSTPPPMPTVEGTQQAVEAADVLLRWCDQATAATQPTTPGEPQAVPLVDLVDRVRSVLSKPRGNIFEAIVKKPTAIMRFSEVARIPGGFRDSPPSDDAVKKALARLSTDLADNPAWGCTLSISDAKGLVTLNLPPDK